MSHPWAISRSYKIVLRRWTRLVAGMLIALSPCTAGAEVPVQRTFYRLCSSNGYGALLVDLTQRKLTHFREHLFATEEPELDAAGQEVWIGNQPAAVSTRDVLFDAYFGLRAAGEQRWLTTVPVDLDASGYASWTAGKTGGSGVVTMIQHVGELEASQFFFAPQGLPNAGFVMAMRVRNTGTATITGVSAFSLHNFHLGFGRPGVLNGDGTENDIGEQGETISFDGSNGKADFVERAFAGTVVARALGPVARHGASATSSPPGENVYEIVAGGGTTDLPDLNGTAPTQDGSVSAFQFDWGDLVPGQEKWAGVVFAHHGDPFAGPTVQSTLDAYVGQKDAQALTADEIAGWAAFQTNTVQPPPSLSDEEETLLRQSAAMLKMAQVREETAYLREFLTQDGIPRWTRFGTAPGNPPATLPALITHRGKGAILASLPPGVWTYAWIRDGAYATVAMANLGMFAQAKDALVYYLDAEAGRFQNWNELKPYAMPPYRITLVRYHGFGVEETDFNAFGPNLEFDGFGLFLWALRSYELLSQDESVTDAAWPVVSSQIADALVALVDPDTGLIRPDSSIWETHWNGRERFWTYTSITAVRGLCDAAAIAKRKGDAALEEKYRTAALALRGAIATKLTDASLALGSNLEELAAGQGYWDAAVLDAIALGLFHPMGKIARATLDGLDGHLVAPAGAGWSRNDDRTDHAGSADLSPWGSDYDSAEWVITDLRGAVATRMMGETQRSDRLLAWVRDQSVQNYLAISETYNEENGTYKFNAPMAGFGAGAYALALYHRAGRMNEPACGAYFDESTLGGGGSGGGASSSTGAAAVPKTPGAAGDCHCRTAMGCGEEAARWGFAVLVLGLFACHMRARGRARFAPRGRKATIAGG